MGNITKKTQVLG